MKPISVAGHPLHPQLVGLPIGMLPFSARSIRYRHPNFWVALPQRGEVHDRAQDPAHLLVPERLARVALEVGPPGVERPALAGELGGELRAVALDIERRAPPAPAVPRG